MRYWNVVISVFDQGFDRACAFLGQFGKVGRTRFYNVLVMHVEDRQAFLDALVAQIEKTPDILQAISRVVPVEADFGFSDPADFDRKVSDTIVQWVPRLANKSFHVRLHRRGLKGVLRSPEEERLFDELLLAELERAGTPGHISFDDPDAVIDIETVGNRAGLAFCTREDVERYAFLRPD